MSKTVLALAYEAGLNPFDQTSINVGMASTIKTNDMAASLLGNRNLYFTKEYADRFGVMVHTIEVSPQRLAMGVVESAPPPNQPDRIFRATIFRCDGEVIYQSPLGRHLDGHAANVDLRYALQHLNETDVLMKLCQLQIKKSARMRDKAEIVLLYLQQRQGP